LDVQEFTRALRRDGRLEVDRDGRAVTDAEIAEVFAQLDVDHTGLMCVASMSLYIFA
jgi:hypothetical protein